jgi:hypothetical protein
VSKKWYEYLVTFGPPAGQAAPPEASTDPPPANAAQSVADIAASVALAPEFTQPVSNALSFNEIYDAAGIQTPPHRYTILKIADMLESEHIRGMAAPVKRSSILVALDAAGVKINDIIQDAVRRDRALDAFEALQARALEKLEADKNKEIAQIQAEMDRYLAEQKARLEKSRQEVAREKDRLRAWREAKRQEEQRIAVAVSYFALDTPITVSPAEQAAPPEKATRSS